MKGAGGASSWGAVSRGSRAWISVRMRGGGTPSSFALAAGDVGSGSGPSLWKRAKPSWQVNSMLNRGTDEQLQSAEMCA